MTTTTHTTIHEAGAEVCGGTGNHDGQAVDACDECCATFDPWASARKRS